MRLDKLKRYGDWALVTGASSGIGLEFAHQLAAGGLNLVLVARRGELLEQHARSLSDEHGIRTETVALDITADDAIETLVSRTEGIDVGLIVLAAGTVDSGHFTKVDIDDHVRLTRLNIEAPMRLARHFSQSMVARRNGAVVFVSSLFGYQGVPVVANYAASKAYILSLGEALSVELKPHGVDVLVVSPGLTDTAMPETMPVDFSKMPITTSTPRKVVRTALGSLGRKATVVPGSVNKLYAWQNRLIPRKWPSKLFGTLLTRAIDPEERDDLLIAKS